MERLTKIVATLGPAVGGPEKVRALVAAGMDVARLNFSHGEQADHGRFAEWVRAASEAEGRPVAILQDIQGPKLRVGCFPGGSVELHDGDEVDLAFGRGEADAGTVLVDYEHLVEDVEVGEEILAADGLIRMEATGKHGDRLRARVLQGGVLGDQKGVAFPHTDLRLPAITDKDRADLVFGAELGVDYVAASFVRTGDQVEEISRLADGAPVIAKIELAAAYANLDDILEVAAGVMVARGDLGVQMPLERIPLVQADILRRANAAGLLSITATEMLESMTHSPRPTRAEVTDVATAVMEGTDAVMLSAETASGDFPVEAVATMARICRAVEGGGGSAPPAGFLATEPPFASAVARAAVEAASDLGIGTIVAFTETGSTARLLSKYRPVARVFAFTPDRRTLSRMALYRGVEPKLFGRRDYTDLMIAAAEEELEQGGFCARGEAVVMVAGIPPNQRASTNLMKVHLIGERDRAPLPPPASGAGPEGRSG